MKNIFFTGGGSGGHLIPATILIKSLTGQEHLQIRYIGSRSGIERDIIGRLSVPYYPIFTGKLRRYHSWENFVDLFRVAIGFFQSLLFMIRLKNKNTLVFSTGGFVSVPVVIAAKITGKTVFIHEQTSRVGLANSICSRFADKIFVSFQDSLAFFPEGKTFVSGYPLRDHCFEDGVGTVKIDDHMINEVGKPILLVTGGANGARIINEKIKECLDELKKNYFIVHQVGKLFIEEYQKLKDENYLPVSFIGDEMIDLYKLATLVVSRAGAGTVSELLALEKRSIFVPLKIAQKNEQYYNALEAKKKLGSYIVQEDEFLQCNLPGIIGEFRDKMDAPEIDQADQRPKNAKKFLLEHINSFYLVE